jgi:hypothetical protein
VEKLERTGWCAFFCPVRFFSVHAAGIDGIAERWFLVNRYPKWCMRQRGTFIQLLRNRVAKQ